MSRHSVSRFAGLLILCLSLSAIATGSVFAQRDNQRPPEFDFYEIESGDEFEGTFHDGVLAHLYQFSGSEDDAVTINMTQDTEELDPFLVLMSSFGEVLAHDNNSGEEFGAAEIADFPLPFDGVYFILATSASETQFGAGSLGSHDDLPDMDYVLFMDGARPSDDDDAFDDIVRIGPGQRAPVEIDGDFPVFLASFEADAGRRNQCHYLTGTAS